MNVVARTLLRAGAESSLVEDFRALADATTPDGEPRYRERPTLEDLARFVARGGAGPNRDAAFYELCHLVNAVDAAGNRPGRRNAFFLEPEAATPARFRARLDRALAGKGWRRAGFQRNDDGIAISYADVSFTIHFARIPFLAALYEFMAGMEDFSFYAGLEAIFDEMTDAPAALKQIQVASNRLASHFRQYRRRHLTHARHDGKFDLLFAFIAERSPEGALVIDDAAVLDFWAQKAAAGDFRAYRTVFDAFANLLRAMDENARAEAMTQAAPIGVDRTKGEEEPDDTVIAPVDEWASPLALLDEPPVSDIKFLKQESERKPIEGLMHYGPGALRLPLAFLRLEVFGPVQSAITTDLQVGRGRERVDDRIGCSDVQSYGEIVTRLENILALVKRLQKAAFYALHKGSEGEPRPSNVLSFPAGTLFDQARSMIEQGRALPDDDDVARLNVEAARTFRAVARKGFEESRLGDEDRRRGFEIGAGALVAIAAHLENYIVAARRLAGRERTLERMFDADRSVFSERFRVLYGVRQ